MATSDVKVTPGSGSNIASYSITEDAETKQVGRVVLNSSAGAEVGTSGAPVRTDPTGTTTQPVSLTAGSAIVGKVTTDQTTHGTTDLVAADVTKLGGNAVNTGNGTSSTGTQRVAIASDNTVLPGVGAGATGSAVPANAAYDGGIAKTALPAAATDGNLTGAMFDKFGRQVMLVGSIRDLVGTQPTTISASTAETTIVTAGASGVFNDIVMIIVSNTSASTNTRIDFRDATGGSVLFSLESVGGAAPIGFALPVPIPQTTAANNWTAQCATSTTDIRVYVVYVKNK